MALLLPAFSFFEFYGYAAAVTTVAACYKTLPATWYVVNERCKLDEKTRAWYMQTYKTEPDFPNAMINTAKGIFYGAVIGALWPLSIPVHTAMEIKKPHLICDKCIKS